MSEFSFSAPPRFQPHRLARGAHLQTILPYFLGPDGPYRAQQHRVVLEDDDVIVLHDDTPSGWSAGDRIVMLVHGLGGYHGSSYMARLAAAISRARFRVLRLDMRGCGAGLLLARGVFHADRSDDLLAAIRFVEQHFPGSPITICAFSLGANLTLKMMGDLGERSPESLDSALVVEPPIDLGYCCRFLGRGLGWVYDRYFAKMLWQDFHQRRTVLTGADRISITRAPTTLLAFDRAITAPLAGFRTADDYYHSASSANVLRRITVPTAILSAANDPVVPPHIYDDILLSPTTQLFIAEGGGHLGFYSVANEDAPNRRWMDCRLLQWIQEIDQHQNQAPSSIR
jgi:predicted alpha/beta-fold hydrolase